MQEGERRLNSAPLVRVDRMGKGVVVVCGVVCCSSLNGRGDGEDGVVDEVGVLVARQHSAALHTDGRGSCGICNTKERKQQNNEEMISNSKESWEGGETEEGREE